MYQANMYPSLPAPSEPIPTFGIASAPESVQYSASGEYAQYVYYDGGVSDATVVPTEPPPTYSHELPAPPSSDEETYEMSEAVQARHYAAMLQREEAKGSDKIGLLDVTESTRTRAAAGTGGEAQPRHWLLEAVSHPKDSIYGAYANARIKGAALQDLRPTILWLIRKRVQVGQWLYYKVDLADNREVWTILDELASTDFKVGGLLEPLEKCGWSLKILMANPFHRKTITLPRAGGGAQVEVPDAPAIWERLQTWRFTGAYIGRPLGRRELWWNVACFAGEGIGLRELVELAALRINDLLTGEITAAELATLAAASKIKNILRYMGVAMNMTPDEFVLFPYSPMEWVHCLGVRQKDLVASKLLDDVRTRLALQNTRDWDEETLCEYFAFSPEMAKSLWCPGRNRRGPRKPRAVQTQRAVQPSVPERRVVRVMRPPKGLAPVDRDRDG